MTIDELKTNIAFLKQDSLTVELFFLFNKEDEIHIRRARIADNIQVPIIHEIISPFLDRELGVIEDIIEYDPTSSPDRRTLFQIKQEEIEQYALSTNTEIAEFDNSNGYNDVWAYMIKVSQGTNEIVVVRKKFGSHTLKKGFSLWLSQGQFARFDRDVFTLDEHIDAFLFNGVFYVFQRTNFERSFLFDQKIKVQAERNAKELITEYKLLTLEEEKIEEYLDAHSISRLRKIDLSLIEDGTMSYDNLSQFCNEFGITIERNDDAKKFEPQDKKQFKLFVKLLSDDFLQSGLTQRRYAVHSKERVDN